MVEKDKVIPPQKVRHVGFFDFKETYRYAYLWWIEEGYDLVEKNYTEKITQRGKEVEIEWLAIKKISDYFRFFVVTKWRVVGMNDAEVEQGGKKIKIDKGDCEIKVEQIVLEKDWESRWEGGPFWKFLRGMYDKYIIRSRIDAYEGKLVGEVNDFIDQMKGYLALSIK